MHFSFETLALQLINVLVLMWLLNRYVFRPLGQRLAERRNVIADAEQKLQAQVERTAAIQAQLDAAHAENERLRLQALADSRNEIAGERQSVLNAAQAEGRNIIARAGAQAGEIERAAAARIERQAMDAALDTTRSLFRELSPALLDQAYLEQARAWLAENPLPEGQVRIQIAEAKFRNDWQALVPGAEIIIEPELVAGCIIDMGSRHFGFNIRDRINAIAERLFHE